MVNTPGSSFIPKRSTGKTVPRRSGKRIYIFSYVAYVVFFGTLLSVGGIFFLEQQAERQLEEHIALLEAERQSFNTSQLEEIKALDSRLRIALTILDRHSAPSLLFEALEQVVVDEIQFTNFGYNRTETAAAVTLNGVADSFDALLFQQEVIKDNQLLAAAEVTQVTVGGSANVIEGANRDTGPTELSPSGTRLTFTFLNSDVSAQINYRDRLNQNAASRTQTTPVEQVVPVESGTSSPVNQVEP